MESRFPAHAGASLIAVLLAALPATAAPTRPDAKKLFEKALTLYQSGDFKAAVDALGKSFKLQADPDTLFAWAQAERKLGDCAKAIELYDKLLKYDLPAENRDAVNDSRTECQAIVSGASKPDDTPPPSTDTPPDTGTPPPTDTPPTPPPTTGGNDQPQAKDGDTPFAKQQQKAEGGAQNVGGGHAWWKDPVGDALVVIGLGGVGVGAAFLVSASKANSDEKSATTFGDAETLKNRAHDQGQLGVIATGAGAAFVAGGIVWYVTHRHHDDKPAMTGWLAPSGGGIAIAGSF